MEQYKPDLGFRSWVFIQPKKSVELAGLHVEKVGYISEDSSSEFWFHLAETHWDPLCIGFVFIIARWLCRTTRGFLFPCSYLRDGMMWRRGHLLISTKHQYDWYWSLWLDNICFVHTLNWFLKLRIYGTNWLRHELEFSRIVQPEKWDFLWLQLMSQEWVLRFYIFNNLPGDVDSFWLTDHSLSNQIFLNLNRLLNEWLIE